MEGTAPVSIAIKITSQAFSSDSTILRLKKNMVAEFRHQLTIHYRKVQ